MKRTLLPFREGTIRPFEELYKEMDNLVQHFVGDDGKLAIDKFAPRVNLVETESHYEVTADLPGVDPNDVNVELHDDHLTISGKKASPAKEDGKTYLRVERRFGEFRRVIPIPTTVDEGKIEADYNAGVLKVTLPKSEKVKPTKIHVKTS